jgi:transposase-like protein
MDFAWTYIVAQVSFRYSGSMRKSRLNAQRMSAAQRNQIGREYEAGNTTTELSRKHGVCQSFVARCVTQSGRSIRPATVRAAGKLSELQKSEAIRRYLDGATCQQIADHFGLKQQASVWEMLSRRGIVRPSSIANRRHSLRQDAFDVLAPEASYWVGFLITDGCISDSLDGPRLILSLAEKDAAHVELFRSFIGASHPIRVASNAGGYGSGKSASLHIRACGLAPALARLGVVPKKTSTAAAPSHLAFDRDFWRGCIDGDGTVSIHTNRKRGYRIPFIQLVGASRTLIEQFATYVRSISSAMASIEFSRGVYVTRAGGSAASRVISTLYANASVSLARKREAAESVIKLSNAKS